ncbi:MAG TPA: AzlC family ABC transporter permease [Candidatus Methylomirabilis sp.]|nr:AzlC family ABC transporter permease [Candidatus Methylomirabilis sp.]
MSQPPPSPSAGSPSRRLRDGLWATLPLIPGVAVFGVVYGVLARQAGLNLWATLGMSALVFAGASQFIAVSMWGQAGGGAIILTTCIIKSPPPPDGGLAGPVPAWRAQGMEGAAGLRNGG